MAATAKIDDVLERARRGRNDDLVLTDRPWLVYGCGSTGRAWAGALASAGALVRAFVDRHAPDGQALPVLRPETCPASWKAECFLLIGLHNPGVDIGAVRAELQDLGFAHVVLLQELIDRFPERSHFCAAPSAAGHQRLPPAGRPLGPAAPDPALEPGLPFPHPQPLLQRLRHRPLRTA